MFNDRLQLASPRKREVSRKRYDADVIVNRVILDTWCCWPRCWRIACSIALTTVGRADAQSLAGRDESTSTPPQRHVYTEAKQGGANGA